MIHDQALVPIRESVIGSLTVPSVNARDLHSAIGSKRQFSNWVLDRIRKYRLTAGVDFIAYTDNSKANHITSKEYMLTLDTAKELAMVENTSQGRTVRRYFIELERRYLSERTVPGMLPGHSGASPALAYPRVTSLDLDRIENCISQVKGAAPAPRRCVIARQIWSDLWQIAGGRRESRRLLPSDRMPQYLSYLADMEHHERDNAARHIAQSSVNAIQQGARSAPDLALSEAAAKLGMSPGDLYALLREVDVCDQSGILGKSYTNGRMFKQVNRGPIVITRQGQLWLSQLIDSRSQISQQKQLSLLVS